jgi:SAM-dependent methyltransferase
MSRSKTSRDRLRLTGSRALALAADLAHRGQQALDSNGGPPLQGDRGVEWSFCFSRMANGPGDTLDFGADIGFLALAAAQRGHNVVALDRLPPALEYSHERVTPLQADILDRPLGDRRFDQIVNCSSMEHVGLAGRYGSGEAPDGDLEAMAILREALAPGGRMILTIPVGQDQVCAPFHRVYGEERLPRLLDGYQAAEEQFWVKRAAAWEPAGRAEALATPGSRDFYSLGLFVLTDGGDR